MRRSGKRPLGECLSENNGPPNNKRSRPEVTPTLSPAPSALIPSSGGPSRGRRRRRRDVRSVQTQSQSHVDQGDQGTRSGTYDTYKYFLFKRPRVFFLGHMTFSLHSFLFSQNPYCESESVTRPRPSFQMSLQKPTRMRLQN